MKKKNMKFLSLVLALVMVFSMFPVTALAATTVDGITIHTVNGVDHTGTYTSMYNATYAALAYKDTATAEFLDGANIDTSFRRSTTWTITGDGTLNWGTMRIGRESGSGDGATLILNGVNFKKNGSGYIHLGDVYVTSSTADDFLYIRNGSYFEGPNLANQGGTVKITDSEVLLDRIWTHGTDTSPGIMIVDNSSVTVKTAGEYEFGLDSTDVTKLHLQNGSTMTFSGAYSDGYRRFMLGAKSKLYIDSSSQLVLNNVASNGEGGLRMPAGARIILDGSEMEPGEECTVIRIKSTNGLWSDEDSTDIISMTENTPSDVTFKYTYNATGSEYMREVIMVRAEQSLEHEHEYTDEEVTVLATCTEEGEKKIWCECGEDYTTEGIPALGHVWAETSEDGSAVCSDCELTVENVQGDTYNWEFWKDGFTKNSTGLTYFSNGEIKGTDYAEVNSSWGGFRDNGFVIGSTYGISMTSKETINGDYSFQAQVTLDDGQTWTTIWPQYIGAGTSVDPSYRIELTYENGIRVGYDNAYRYANTAVDADKLIDNNTVTAMELKTPYMLKWEKEGATLRIKFWKRADGEPETWNFEITHEGVIDTAEGKFRADYYYNKDVYVPALTDVFHCEYIKFTKSMTAALPDVEIDLDTQERTAELTPVLLPNIFSGRQQPQLNAQVTYEVVEGEDVITVDAETGELTPLKGGRARVEVNYTDGINTASATGAVRVKVACTEHTWEDATCLDPSYCSACGETTGAALGHDWQDATCTEPETCSQCGKTAGAALGHTWSDDDTCSVCGEEMKQLRILYFGNSYSQYVAYTMYDLVKELDYDRLVIGNFVKGSTTQTAYWDWISGNDTATRTYQELIKNPDGSLTENKAEHTSALPGLTAHDWDYIVLQSYAPESGNSLNANSAMANMVDYVNTHATNPDMQLVYPINWSSTRDMNMYNLGSTYREVWERVLASYDYPAGTSPFDVAIPIGTLVEIGRGSWYNEAVGSNLTCDGYHLDPVGNYLFVMAYMTALTDEDISPIGTRVREMGYDDNGVRRILTNSVTDAQAELCKAIVRVANDAPHDFITYAAVTAANGQMTRYETLIEATAAAKSGDTIEILQVCKNDTKLDIARGVKVIYYTADGKVTADLSGGGYIDSTGLHGTFSVDYVLDGGTNAASNPVSFSSEDETIALTDAQKTGYTFGGWFADADMIKQVTAIEQGTSVNLTLYAKWIANSYTIAFEAGEGSGEMESVTARYGRGVTLPANAFTNGSKFFAGWDTDAAATMPVYADGAEVRNLTAENGATVTLYAVWTEEQPAEAYSVSVSSTLDGDVWADCGRKFDLVSKEKTYADYKGQAIVVPGIYDVYAENADGAMQDTGLDVTVADKNTGTCVNFVTAVFYPNISGQEAVRWAVINGVSCDITTVVDQVTEAAAAYDLTFAGFAGLDGNSITIESYTEFTAEHTFSSVDVINVSLSVEELAADANLPQPEAVSVKLGQVEVDGVWTVNGGKVTGAAVRGTAYTYAATFAIPAGYALNETAVLPAGWSIADGKLICTFDALTAVMQLRVLFVGNDVSQSGNAALESLLDTLDYDGYVVDVVEAGDWSTPCAAIETQRWDYVVLQPGAEEATASISANEAMMSFAAYVKENAVNPNTKLAFLMNWSGSGDAQQWQKIVNAYDFANNETPFDLVIPVGTAIQNGRLTFWSETEDALLVTADGDLNDLGACVYAVTLIRMLTSEPIGDLNIRGEAISLADEQLIKAFVETTATNPIDRLTYASVNSRVFTVLNFYETLEEAVGVSADQDLLELYGICKSSERLDIASGVTLIYYTETGKRTTYLPDGGYIDADGLHSLSAVVEQAQIGTVKYETLAEALAAAQTGDTVTLLADVTEAVTVSKAVTIARNGFSANLIAADGYAVKVTDTAYVVMVEEEPTEPESVFSDITPSSEYYEAAEYVVSNGIMTPIIDNRFGAKYAGYRSTVVSVLWGMENKPKVDHEMTFTDVSGESYTEAIRWANANGIIYGVSSTKFSPMAELTKEHLLTILYRYTRYKNNASAGEDVELKFTDASRISDYAVDAVKWACSVGLIENSETALKPRKAVIRGDFAQILMSFCENVAN